MSILISFAVATAVVIPVMRWAVRHAPLDTDLWAGGADEPLEAAVIRHRFNAIVDAETWDRS